MRFCCIVYSNTKQKDRSIAVAKKKGLGVSRQKTCDFFGRFFCPLTTPFFSIHSNITKKHERERLHRAFDASRGRER
jgi:hypothetical protein